MCYYTLYSYRVYTVAYTQRIKLCSTFYQCKAVADHSRQFGPLHTNGTMKFKTKWSFKKSVSVLRFNIIV